MLLVPLTDFVSAFLAALPDAPAFYVFGFAAIFITAASKGAFGGGLPITVPLLAMAIDPVSAAVISAPLLVAMDVMALRYFGFGNASRVDLASLIPGMLLGLGIGWALFEFVDHRLVALAIAIVTLAFVVHWFVNRKLPQPLAMPPKPVLGAAAGALSGFTSFIAHAGGPPVMMYLLRRQLDKTMLAGTMIAFFFLANLLKMVPFGFIMARKPELIVPALLLLPAVPVGIVIGKMIHDRLEQKVIYFWCHVILIFVALKMFYDALKGLL
jgi:uncharacterized protein